VPRVCLRVDREKISEQTLLRLHRLQSSFNDESGLQFVSIEVEGLSIGQVLKLARLCLGLSQEAVAIEVRLHQSQISRLETGKGGKIKVLAALWEFYKPRLLY
jgi:Helix-turn-helix domain